MNVNINGDVVELDPQILDFDENTLNHYLQKEAARYAYYSSKWVDASHLAAVYEEEAEAVFSAKYKELKEIGKSDKTSEMLVKGDLEYMDMKKRALDMKRIKDQLWSFLRAIDKNHENAINVGYNIRKELTTLQQNSIKKDSNFD